MQRSLRKTVDANACSISLNGKKRVTGARGSSLLMMLIRQREAVSPKKKTTKRKQQDSSSDDITKAPGHISVAVEIYRFGSSVLGR